MQLKYETQELVPEDLKESFVEFKDGDQSSWIHKDLAEAKKEAYRFKGDLTNAQKLAQEKADKLKAFEDAEADRQAEKERIELESKKKNGQHDEILEDFKSKSQAEIDAREARIKELEESIKNKEKSAVVNDLAGLGIDSTRTALKRLVEQDLQFGDNGSLVVMQDGKATSMTVDEYKAKLPELYPYLVGESHSKGGQANGGNGSGSPSGTKLKLSNTTQGYLANLK